MSFLSSHVMSKNIFTSAIMLLGAVLGFNSCISIPKGAIPVQYFDKEKYLGKWYEIARMDYRFERNLNHVTATYSLKNDGTIKVDNKGYNYKTNKWEESIGKAKPAGKPEEGKLKVSFFGPFYAAYNVIAIEKDYKYALIVGKNLNYIWILSRETTLPEDVKQNYLKIAKDIGYDTQKLIWVDQSTK
jgi:apolipoprotein D and lipocalin family protein